MDTPVQRRGFEGKLLAKLVQWEAKIRDLEQRRRPPAGGAAAAVLPDAELDKLRAKKEAARAKLRELHPSTLRWWEP